jgi:hypothetical protein
MGGSGLEMANLNDKTLTPSANDTDQFYLERGGADYRILISEVFKNRLLGMKSYTKAAFDALANGSLAFLTDQERGLWVRSNGRSIKVSGPRIHMKDFAPADGTNQVTAINAAIAAAANNDVPIELETGIYGVNAALDSAVDDVRFIAPNGRAILAPTTSNDLLSGAYHGWRFENVEFRGACILTDSRKPEFRQCAFRHPSNYAIQMRGVVGAKFIDPEFYGTRAGVMASGDDDPAAVPSAVYGSGLRLQAGCTDVQVIRPRFHFCHTGIGADTSTTSTMRGLYVENIQGRSDWWNSPFIVGRYTPTAYNSETRRLTVDGGGLNAIFSGESLRVISIPIQIATATGFNLLSLGTVGVASGTPFASAQKGDVIETADGRRAEILSKISSTQVAILGWEDVATFEPTAAPSTSVAWRLTRYYAAGVVLVSDTQIDLYNDPVNPFSGERLVEDAGLDPVGISCKTFATTIYSNLHLNGGVFDFQMRGGRVRGCRADQISVFDCEAPKITGVNVEYGFDEGITLTRCPRAVASKNHFEQAGVSAISIGDCDYASVEGNIINNWGIINRNDLGAIDGNGRYMSIRGNIGKVSAGGPGSGAQHLIALQYDADCSGTVIEGNVDGGARTATLKTHAHTGVITARDVHSISGNGRDNVLTGSGDQWSLRTGLMEYFPLTADAVGKKVGVVLTNTGSVAFGSDGATFGSGKVLSVPHNSLFTMGGDASFEFVLTVKFNALTDGHIFAKYTGGASTVEYFLEYYTGTSRIRWWVSNGTTLTNVAADALGTPSTGTSYFIRCGYDHITQRIFIQVNNGTVNYEAHAGGAQATTEPFGIGARGDGYLPFAGSVRGLGLYKQRKLNSADVTKLYNGGTALAWPLL